MLCMVPAYCTLPSYTANGQRCSHGTTHCSQHHCPVMKYIGSDATELFDLQHVLCLSCSAGITFLCNTEFIGAHSYWLVNRDVPDIHPVPVKCQASHYLVLPGLGKIMGPSNNKKQKKFFFTQGIIDPSGRQKLC